MLRGIHITCIILNLLAIRFLVAISLPVICHLINDYCSYYFNYIMHLRCSQYQLNNRIGNGIRIVPPLGGISDEAVGDHQLFKKLRIVRGFRGNVAVISVGKR